MNTKLKHALMAGALLMAAQARATIAYDNASAPQNQSWQGNLGLDFDVNTPIVVTALGAFDSGNPANLLGAVGSGVTVQIFSTSGAPVGPSVTFGPTSVINQINGDAFQVIAPITLQPGNYSIVTLYDENYNVGYYNNVFNSTSTTSSGGGLISFVGSGRFDYNSTIDLPSIIDGGPANRYDAGTFQFQAVPEPTTIISGMLMLLPFGASTLRILRRNRVA